MQNTVLGRELTKNSAIKNLTVKKGRLREAKMNIKCCEAQAQKRKCLGEQSLGQVAWLGEEATEHPGKRH